LTNDTAYPCYFLVAMSQASVIPTVSQTHSTPKRSGGTATMAGPRPGRYYRFSFITCFFMTLFHIGAVWALFDFTWSGVAVLLATYYVSLAWGIGMWYHRPLTTRGV